MSEHEEITEKRNETEISPNAAFVVNIKYSKTNFRGKKKEDNEENYPTSVILDIPERIMNLKDKPNFLDIVESFIYNTLTGKYKREVTYCQTYIQ